ncbi:hypothetical protein PEX2_077310 [Penicillium expansum]|uniref:Uncharacterized protein n=1 Tax=Penicillium expansum TaxID=27334 RepID=A0A0A2JL79_PENEN|nr:hypothetical protein PEX2_077310 [Penicillium expansum]KGO56124.1 hypothetical protein PEX2_077310 [Penicillium expansum]
MLASMKKVTTSFIPKWHLQILRIDLNHLDIACGMTSPSVTRYFMPRTDTPRIEKIRADPSWDWFLSQKGNFGKGTHSANSLLRRVFIYYQDWSIPEFWPNELDGAKSEEIKNNESPTVQGSDHPVNTKDDKVSDGEGKSDDKEVSESEKIDSEAKEGEILGSEKHGDSDEDCGKSEESDDENRKPRGEIHEKSKQSEKTDKEADNDREMVIANALDLDIRNYMTNDWLVYWAQRLYDLDLPDKIHGISFARSMELDHPHKCHAWALVDVISCGHDRPSTAELIALVSWGLRGMFGQMESLANGIEPEDVHILSEVFPCLTKDVVPVYYTVTLMVDSKFNLHRS